MKAKKTIGYVDGFVLTVPKEKLSAYRRMARKAKEVWMEHGALDFHECVGDDMDTGMGIPFPRLAKPKAGEVVLFSWIAYESKAQRKRVNKLAMKDPRLASMDPSTMPFDCKRMSVGGFKVIV